MDEALLEQMKLQGESPDDPRQRRVKKQEFAKSKFNADDLKTEVGDKVWVKCISEAGPWADEKQLKYWEDYLIPAHEAVMLDERRFAVILVPETKQSKKKETK